MDYSDDFEYDYTPEDLYAIDQIEEACVRTELKTYFLNNAMPKLLAILAAYIGVPKQTYECLEVDFPNNCLRRMSKIFDIWYPYAKEIGRQNGLLPIHIMTYVNYQNRQLLYSAPVVDTTTKEFIEKNKRRIYHVIQQIHSVMRTSNNFLQRLEQISMNLKS